MFPQLRESPETANVQFCADPRFASVAVVWRAQPEPENTQRATATTKLERLSWFTRGSPYGEYLPNLNTSPPAKECG